MGWLTNQEFLSAPTSTSTADLVTDGGADAQAAELARQLSRATGFCDNACNFGLRAVARTETRRIRASNDGSLLLHPGPWPLISLTALSIGVDSSNLVAVPSLGRAWIEEESFIVPASWGFGPTIQLGTFRPGGRMLASYTYVAGYPHAELRATCAVGAVALTVSSTVGMTAGTVLSIVDGELSEQVTVTAVTSSTVVAVTALVNGHDYVAGPAAAIAVHTFPEDYKLAATLVASALLKTRGNDSMVMSNLLQPGSVQGADPTMAQNLRLARDLLMTARRVW